MEIAGLSMKKIEEKKWPKSVERPESLVVHPLRDKRMSELDFPSDGISVCVSSQDLRLKNNLLVVTCSLEF